ncbi:hypothetical protein JCM31739_08880 [Faecalimonas canis]
MTADIEDYEEFIDEDLRNQNDYYEALENNELVGFFCIIQQNSLIEIGLGMKPDLCGKGKGKQFVKQIINFLEYNYKFDKLIMNVALFNQRAIKVYHSCGFKDFEITSRNSNGGIYEFLTLVKRYKLEFEEENMKEYTYVTLRQKPELKEEAAAWFHDKWGVPQEAYLECIEAYLNNETEYGWYFCLDSGRIVGGLGVIENDFHDRKDLTPNVCAVYTEKDYRCQGIVGKLLDIVVKDMKSKGITPIYLITDHTSFYERYGWEFLCMVQGDDELDMTRMYIHR